MLKPSSLAIVLPGRSNLILATGQSYQVGGIVFQIIDLRDMHALVRHSETFDQKLIPIAELTDAIQNGTVVNMNDSAVDEELSSEYGTLVSPTAMRVAESKKTWLRALRAEGFLELKLDDHALPLIIDRLHSTTLQTLPKYSVTTLVRAQRLADNTRHPLALLPNFYKRGGAGKSRLDARVETIIEEVIRSAAEAHDSRIVLTHIVDSVFARIREQEKADPSTQFIRPGRSTIYRRVGASISKYTICYRNEGKARANRKFRSNPKRITAEMPLEVIECDDIDVGVFLVDDITGLPIGRAFLTSSIDQFSRVPLGMSLSHRHRDTESAQDCLVDSLHPKLESTYGDYANKWIGYGYPGITLLDNATYNHSSQTIRSHLELETILAFAKPHTPTEKSAIEHFNHRIKNDFGARLPGWRGEKGDNDALKHGHIRACVSLQFFRQRYLQWVCEEYLLRPNEFGKSPAQRWREHFVSHQPAVPFSRFQTTLLRLNTCEIRFRASGGLKLLGFRYCSDELNELRQTLGRNAKVVCYQDRSDLTRVLVKHPHTNKLLNVPCLEDSKLTAGINLYQQRLILKHARALKNATPNLADIVAARESLALQVRQLSSSTRLRDRHKSAALSLPIIDLTGVGDSALDPSSDSEVQAPIIMTEIEYQMSQLDRTQLVDDEEWGDN
jgi:hypothetical protein